MSSLPRDQRRRPPWETIGDPEPGWTERPPFPEPLPGTQPPAVELGLLLGELIRRAGERGSGPVRPGVPPDYPMRPPAPGPVPARPFGGQPPVPSGLEMGERLLRAGLGGSVQAVYDAATQRAPMPPSRPPADAARRLDPFSPRVQAEVAALLRLRPALPAGTGAGTRQRGFEGEEFPAWVPDPASAPDSPPDRLAADGVPRGGDAAPDATSRREPIISVPKYRNQVPELRRSSWQDWADSVRRLPGLSSAEERAHMEVFAAEGGTGVDEKTGAASGILPGTLHDLQERRRIDRLPLGTAPDDLTMDEKAKIYRAYIDDGLKHVGGSGALERIGDDAAAASLADTLFRHGATGGAELVRAAINDVVPGSVRQAGQISPDGNTVSRHTMNEEAFAAYRKLAKDPATRRKLLDALKWQRDFDKPGEAARTEHFRFPDDPEKAP